MEVYPRLAIISVCQFSDFVLHLRHKSAFFLLSLKAVSKVFYIADMDHFCFLPIHFKE